MIDRLLLLARADAARIQPELRAVGLRALLDEFHDTYSLLAQEKQMRILWKLDVAEQWICDPDWLRQILHNLLGNVVRHGSHKARFSARTSQGQLRVRIINYVSPCTSFGAASTAILPGDGNGMGIGLRLVEKLVALLPGSSLKIRRTPRAFSVHLLLRF